MSYSFDNGQTVKSWREGQPFPSEVLDHVRVGGRVRAWNASFEYHIWNSTLLRQIGMHTGLSIFTLSLAQLEDTMAAAAYWGLPLSLDQAGPAAGLPFKKDADGHRLMMRMCRPRSVDPDGTVRWWHLEDPAKFDQLVAYCEQDVRVEAAIAQSIFPLPDQERNVWVLDQRINSRGVTLDMDLITKLKDLALKASDKAHAKISALTGGAVPKITNTKALQQYLSVWTPYPHDNLRKDVVAERLDDPECVGHERELLELRADNAKTSAAKLQAMIDAAEQQADGSWLVRGMLQYYGASRTGRWAGRLIQMQNMPRGVIPKDQVPLAIAAIKAGADIDVIEALFGPAMGVVSSCLRGCIIARPNHALVVPDFSQIEARVLPWLSGQNDILEVFARGDDVYTYTANRIGSDSRQLGKVLVLACGFGMSGAKFQATAATYGLILSLEQANSAVAQWRQSNDRTVQFWWACDAAAKRVIRTGGHVDVGFVRFGMVGKDMVIRLPSGRHLVYRDARLRDNPDRPGTEEITYMGINQYTRRWERLRTYGGKLVENITQAVARDVMANTMQEADRRNIDMVLTVHDELLAEVLINSTMGPKPTLTALLNIMSVPPKWAPGLPVAGAGWTGDRYRKD
jgi:DNA polymerase